MTICRIRVGWSGTPGGNGVTTLYGNCADVVTASAWRTTVGDFFTSLEEYQTNAQSWQLLPETDFLDPDTGELTEIVNINDSISGAGSSTGQPLPWATQGLITWRTDSIVSGRRLQGRTFLPGFVEDNNTGGVMNDDLVTALVGSVSDYLTAAGGSPVVYSRRHHSFAQVTTGTVHRVWAVLRSRRS